MISSSKLRSKSLSASNGVGAGTAVGSRVEDRQLHRHDRGDRVLRRVERERGAGVHEREPDRRPGHGERDVEAAAARDLEQRVAQLGGLVQVRAVERDNLERSTGQREAVR